MLFRSVDIVRASLIFDGPTVERRDDRRDYGEDRFISIGMVGDDCYVVVWTPRGGTIRLITASQPPRALRPAAVTSELRTPISTDLRARLHRSCVLQSWT